MNDTELEIRITTSPEQAWRLLEDLVDNEDVRKALSSHDTAADALAAYGIYLSPDAIPPQPEIPSQEEAREGLEELRKQKDSAAVVPPHVGFRPPWCTNPPSHSATFGLVFGVVTHVAEPPAPAE